MHLKARFFYLISAVICLLVFSAAGCSGGNSDLSNHSEARRETVTNCLMPQASGSVTYGSDIVSIDASNTSEGYVMVCYTGASSKVKLQITRPDQIIYNYNLKPGDYETFPFSGGSGSYLLSVLEHVDGNQYAIVFSQTLSVEIRDEFRPFLYPNQYVWFTPESKATALGSQISANASNDLDYVEQVYRYIIKNISYDEALASSIPWDYLPDIDHTLDVKKGICFDYASLMAAMLRSQNIPTKLVVGYSKDTYHAWISVYLKETGWVNNIIQFDGKNWSLMDPTLAANNSDRAVKEYMGDGSSYTAKYFY